MASYASRGARSGGQYENMAKEKYFALGQRLFRLNSEAEQKDLLGLVQKITENVINKSDDPKFLCLKSLVMNIAFIILLLFRQKCESSSKSF